MPGEIRVFVADDHAIVRDGLQRILDATEGMCCAGTGEDGHAVLSGAAEFDVLVLDLSGLGESGGIEVLDRLARTRPGLPVVVYSMYPEEQYGVRMLKAGARAYLCKDRPMPMLLEAIRRVARGQRYVTPLIAERLLDSPTGGGADLSTRELQVIQLLVAGRSARDISQRLAISPSTVSTHVRHAKDKLGASSTAELVRIAMREGLLD